MKNAKMRVEIPTNPKKELKLAMAIYEKHQTEGNDSPLKNITANNWSNEGPNIEACMLKDKEAEDFKAKMETAYKERDLLLPGIDKAVKASRDVLTGVHHDNMKRLTEWGFEVTESAKNNNKKDNDDTKNA